MDYMNTQVIEVLNKQVADWNVLFTKLHNFHWYVKGPHFFVLHEKFEQYYTEAAEHIDEIAERILAIGGKPVATMKEYLTRSSVQEASYGETAEGMVESILKDYEMMLDELKKGMEIAENANDETTSDLLLGIYTELEKHAWMLRAFLNK